MHSHRSFRSLSVVLLLTLLFAPWAAEARPSEAPRADASANQSIINHFVSWLGVLWGNVGCTVDPNGGGCRESLESACTWDPNGGGCREHLEEGCGWDPNGGSCRAKG